MNHSTATPVFSDRLLIEMRSALPHLPRALVKLTEFILDNPQSAVFSSIADLAQAAVVGEATIIRLSRRFGYSGYQDFKLALAANLAKNPPNDVSDQGTLSARNLSLFQSSRDLLLQTIQANPIQTQQAAIGLIRESNNLLIFGAGISSTIAREFAFRFLRAGVFAVAFEDIHEAALSLQVQRDRTILLVLSTSGQTAEALRALSIAKEQGLTTIAITPSAHSAVAQQAQINLFTPQPPSSMEHLVKMSQLLLLEIIVCELVLGQVVLP